MKEIKGLLSKPVSRTKDAFVTFVENGEGPHAIEFLNATFAPFLICLKQNFGIRLTSKMPSLRRELCPKFNVIVDLTVKAEIYCPDDSLISAEIWVFEHWMKTAMDDFFADEFSKDGVQPPRAG